MTIDERRLDQERKILTPEEASIRKIAKPLLQAGFRPDVATGAATVTYKLYEQMDALRESGIELPEAKGEIIRLGELVAGGKVLHIVAPTCPDYSYRQTGTGSVYDFKTLGDGVGLALGKVLTRIPTVISALTQSQFPTAGIKQTVLLADVEADDPEIRRSVGLDREEFMAKVNGSVEAARTALTELPLGEAKKRVGMLSNFINDEDKERAKRALAQVSDGRLQSIAISRCDLYERWFKSGSGDFMSFAMNRALEDIRKYLEFGMAARRQGVIILEGTAPEITTLYNIGNELPPSPVIRIGGTY